VGTDHATYASLDRGQTFHGFAESIPFTPVHDLKIQARDNHLLVGTHGRSIYQVDLDTVSPLDDDLMAQTLHAFDGGSMGWSSRWGSAFRAYSPAIEPEMTFDVWASRAGSATVRIEDQDGTVLQSFEADLAHGLNQVAYDLSVTEEGAEAFEEPSQPAGNGKRYLQPGTFAMRVMMTGAETETSFELRAPRGGRFEPAPAPDPVWGVKK